MPIERPWPRRPSILRSPTPPCSPLATERRIHRAGSDVQYGARVPLNPYTAAPIGRNPVAECSAFRVRRVSGPLTSTSCGCYSACSRRALTSSTCPTGHRRGADVDVPALEPTLAVSSTGATARCSAGTDAVDRHRSAVAGRPDPGRRDLAPRSPGPRPPRAAPRFGTLHVTVAPAPRGFPKPVVDDGMTCGRRLARAGRAGERGWP